MADDDAGEEDEEEGGGGKKKIIMIVGGLAALGAVYNFVLKPSPPPEDMAMVEEEPMEEEVVEGEILELDEMILNIGGENPGFLRIGIAVVLDELTVAKDFEAESAIAKDVAVHYLSSLDQDQLRSTEGRELAKEELSLLVREAYGEEKVVRVLFTALVMQ
ncbi:MAG: flagellar basal body-associated FliL family protein [Acidimicrobiales bacterium]